MAHFHESSTNNYLGYFLIFKFLNIQVWISTSKLYFLCKAFDTYRNMDFQRFCSKHLLWLNGHVKILKCVMPVSLSVSEAVLVKFVTWFQQPDVITTQSKSSRLVLSTQCLWSPNSLFNLCPTGGMAMPPLCRTKSTERQRCYCVSLRRGLQLPLQAPSPTVTKPMIMTASKSECWSRSWDTPRLLGDSMGPKPAPYGRAQCCCVPKSHWACDSLNQSSSDLEGRGSAADVELAR